MQIHLCSSPWGRSPFPEAKVPWLVQHSQGPSGASLRAGNGFLRVPGVCNSFFLAKSLGRVGLTAIPRAWRFSGCIGSARGQERSFGIGVCSRSRAGAAQAAGILLSFVPQPHRSLSGAQRGFQAATASPADLHKKNSRARQGQLCLIS